MKTKILTALIFIAALSAVAQSGTDSSSASEIPMSDITRRQIEVSEAAPGLAKQASYFDFARRVALASPEVKAALAELEAVEQSGKADNSLSGIEVEGEYKFGPEGDPRWGVSVGQEFDWPGVYSARRTANRFRSEAYRHLYRAAVREQWCAAAEACIDYWQIERQFNILELAAANLSQLDSIYSRLLARGETTLLETKKIALQQAMLNNRLASAAAAQGAAWTVVLNNVYLSGYDNLPHITLDTNPVAHVNVYNNAFDEDDAMASYRSLVKAAEAEITVARRKALPSFRLAYVHDYEDGRHFNGIGLSISLPTWTPKHAVAAARAQATQVQSEFESYLLRSGTKLYADYCTAAALYERVEAAKSLRNMADYPALLRKALDAGRLTLLDYLTEYNFYLEAVEDFNALCADYARARVRIDQYLVTDVLTD